MNRIEKLKKIIEFAEDNQRGGLDYERSGEWIYCNIKNYGFVDRDDLKAAYPKKYHRFIDQISDEVLWEQQDRSRTWEIEYVMECVNDNVDGSDRWGDVVCSKYTYGRSGGWMAIQPAQYDIDSIEDMIEGLEAKDGHYETKEIDYAIEIWDQVMECKDWIEKHAHSYSDLDAMKAEIDDGWSVQWDEEIQREKDIKTIKKLAEKHGLQVGRSLE